MAVGVVIKVREPVADEASPDDTKQLRIHAARDQRRELFVVYQYSGAGAASVDSASGVATVPRGQVLPSLSHKPR
jgi:hypothetical protein